MPSQDRITVLLVEDTAADAALVQAQLAGGEGVAFEVTWVERLDAALVHLRERAPDVVLLDLGLEGTQGSEALVAVRTASPEIPVVVLTGQAGEEFESAALGGGAHDFLVKGATQPAGLRRSLRFAVERQRRENRLLVENQERLAAIFDASPEAIALESNEHLIYVNPAFARLYGYDSPDEIVSLHVSATIAPEEVERVTEMDRARLLGVPMPSTYEFTGLRRDGSRVELAVSVSSAVVGGRSYLLSIERDIARLRLLEAQLLQAQRMESVGRLAGGIAHDFNNLLTAISGFGQLTLEALPADDPLRGNLDEIRNAGERAASLTRQLLAFSRQQVLKPKVIDLNEVVMETLGILRRVIGEDIAIETQFAADLGRVRADPGQIGQVLLNLAVNARDAMSGGGRLTLRTENRHLTGQEGAGQYEVLPGDYVACEMIDTGSGIPPEVLSHVFDPFFTTKEVGKGTGLGLSTVYGIVKQSGGYIWARSDAGSGTSFLICFPRVEEAADAPAPIPQTAAPILRGEETILLVEDEPAVRKLVSTILRSRGYRVLVAGDGLEALQLLESHAGSVKLLLTDVVMPEMSGRELAERVLARTPEVRVVFMSGYTSEVVGAGDLLQPGVNYLQKPFGPESLAQMVRRLLDDKAGAELPGVRG